MKRLLGALACVAAGTALLAVPSGRVTSASELAQVQRIAGADRYDTAAAIFRHLFGRSDSDIVLTSGENFPDALAAPVLHMPILLTARDSLPSSTRSVLEQFPPRSVTIVGGPSAVSDAVADQLRGMGIAAVTRISGADRYDTARAVAEAAAPAGTFGGKPTALLTTGTTFADALAGGPLSYSEHFPILLTTRDTLAPAAEHAIDALGIRFVVIGGGTAAVSETVADRLRGKGIDVIRIAGSTRAETAATAAEVVGSLRAFETVYLVTGRTFADALAVAPMAGSTAEFGPVYGPVLIADGWPQPSSAFVRRHRDEIHSIYAIGGTTAVSDADASAACRDAGSASC